MVLSKAALLSLAALPATQAFFLIPCWPLTTQRLDPIVTPNTTATHLHSIVGGKAFAPYMDYSITQTAECTTCMVSKDKSNYWMPSLFYQNGGSFTNVPQHGSASLYYLNEVARLGSGEKMEPLPVGLRMLAGDPDKRSGSQAFEDQAINYKCLNYKGTPTDSKGFPNQNCPDGLRAEVTFPSCWDGKNLDSDDHRSHMAYPTVTFEAGACPPSHPHHLVTVKMETIFETFNHQFSGNNPFVWSDGDPTGFGLHADLVMGWDYDLLSRAVAECDNTSGRIQDCAPFAGLIPETQQYLDPKTCELDSYVEEDFSGQLSKLPGCNEISYGPGPAVKQACGDSVSLKGGWADARGSFGGAVSSLGSQISSAVAGVWPGAGQQAQPTAAAGQFYQKAADAEKPAVPAYAASSAAPAAPAAPKVDAEGNVITDWVYVTETVTVTGVAPASTATAWNDAAKRDASEHIHKHRQHARRSI